MLIFIHETLAGAIWLHFFARFVQLRSTSSGFGCSFSHLSATSKAASSEAPLPGCLGRELAGNYLFYFSFVVYLNLLILERDFICLDYFPAFIDPFNRMFFIS